MSSLKQINLTPPLLKVFDWRFRAYENCFDQNSFSGQAFTEIYWIGIVDLNLVYTNSYFMPIFFIETTEAKLNLIQDGEYSRYSDGALILPLQKKIFEFNLKAIYKDLLVAKKANYRYFYVFLKEACDDEGVHTVKLLYLNLYGLTTQLRELSQQNKITDKNLTGNIIRTHTLQESMILFHSSYCWSI